MWILLTNKHRILAVLSISKCKGGEMHYIFHDIHILHPQGINIEHETDGVSLFMGYNLQILIFWSQSHGSLVQNDFSFFKRALNNLKHGGFASSRVFVTSPFPRTRVDGLKNLKWNALQQESMRPLVGNFSKKNTRWLVKATVRIHAWKDHWISVMLCHEIGNDNIDESSVMTYHRISYDSTKWKLKCQYRFLAYIRHVRICPRYRRSHAAALDYIRYYELSKRVSLKCWMFISNCVNGLYMLLVSWRT